MPKIFALRNSLLEVQQSLSLSPEAEIKSDKAESSTVTSSLLMSSSSKEELFLDSFHKAEVQVEKVQVEVEDDKDGDEDEVLCEAVREVVGTVGEEEEQQDQGREMPAWIAIKHVCAVLTASSIFAKRAHIWCRFVWRSQLACVYCLTTAWNVYATAKARHDSEHF